MGDVLFSTKASSPYDLALVQMRETVTEAVIPQMAQRFNPGLISFLVVTGLLLFFLGQHLSPHSVIREITPMRTALRLVFSSVSLSVGDPLVVVGYGGVGRRCGPSLTCGILSKAISLIDQPVMLQTTCAVQAGTSGGAVVHSRSGELLGKKPCSYKIMFSFRSVGGI